MKSSRKGFTLIELVVVIGIMGVLYSIVFGSISESKARSRDGKRISDVKQLQLALSQYFDACNQYPATLDTAANCVTVSFGQYIPEIPTDPQTGTAYMYNRVTSTSFCLGTSFEIANNKNLTDNAGCDSTCTLGARCYSVKGP
jgi:prepilin-type N-terminal cleavage/methylation domain-containing protein